MNYILTNSRIYTPDGFSSHDSMLVADGRIKLLGSLSDCRSALSGAVEVIDLKGRALLPAFTDIHTHFNEFARQRFQIDLSGCLTIGEIKERFFSFRQQHAQLPDWVLGGGWDKNRLDSPDLLTKGLLDEFFPNVPVALWSKDYHTRWCNSAALRLAGIDAQTPDPAGGKIGRDSEGHPIGILFEEAADGLKRVIVQLSGPQAKQALRDAAADIHRLGLVGVHSMEGEESARILEEFATGDKTLRICRHFYYDDFAAVIASGRKSYDLDPWYTLGGLKLFADGALGSQTAAVYHEYPGSPGNHGILRHSQEEMTSLVREAASRGYSTTVHAIGDWAVNTVVNAYEQIASEFPGVNFLNRIEHVQAIAAEDIPRIKAIGAFCSVQPVHLANDVDLIESQWAPIRERAYRFKSFFAAGIPVGFGSDAPIETINPFHGIYSAVQRRNRLSPLTPVWNPSECLSGPEAIYGYTSGAARGSNSQNQQGALKEGYFADLIVLEDFTKLADEYWLEARSLLTMLDGRIVWSDGF